MSTTNLGAHVIVPYRESKACERCHGARRIRVRGVEESRASGEQFSDPEAEAILGSRALAHLVLTCGAAGCDARPTLMRLKRTQDKIDEHSRRQSAR